MIKLHLIKLHLIKLHLIKLRGAVFAVALHEFLHEPDLRDVAAKRLLL